MNRVIASVAANLGAAIVAALVGLLSTVLMARWMSLDAFGFVMVLLIAFNAIAALDGLRPVVVYEASNTPHGKRALASASLRAAIGLATCVGAAATLICAAVALDRLGWIGTIAFAAALALYFPISVYWGLLDAQGRTAFTGVARSVAWSAIYCTFVALAVTQAPIALYAVGLAAMNAGLLVVFRQQLRGVVESGDPGNGSAITGRLMRQALNNVSFNLSALVLGSIDRLALAAVNGMTSVGLYSGPYELATKPSALFRVVTLVLFPEAARRHAGGDNLACSWARGTALTFWLVSVAVAVAVALRDELIIFVLGAKFAEAADAFGMLMIGFSLVVLGYACGIVLNAQGNFSLQRTCYGATALATAAAAWPLVSIGLLGAAVLYLLSRLVDPVLLYFSARLVNALPRPSTALLICGGHVGLMLAAWTGGFLAAVALAALFAWALRRWTLEVSTRNPR